VTAVMKRPVNGVPPKPRNDFRTRARQYLIRAGARLGEDRLHDISCVLAALRLGRWTRQLPAPPTGMKVRDDRLETFGDGLALLHTDAPLYLEFGVWQGWSLRWWTEHLDAPGARFVGFDSFEGLQEHWRPDYPRGTFDVDGEPPLVTDPRVSFQVGYFEETLAHFEMPPHDRLFVNVDCTLYSSTAAVLAWLEPHLREGDLIYFDELPEYDHELRALLEHDRRTNLRLMPISQARGYYWLFQYVA
jgi:Methyltransferase domain